MILKVSHVVLSSERFSENKLVLQQLGYTQIFTENNIINSPVKKPLFTHFNERHDVGYFTADKNVSIELLNWRTGNHCSSNFRFLFDALPPDSVRFKSTNTLSKEVWMEGDLNSFNLPISYLNTTEGTCQFNKVMIQTNHIPKSIDFWKYFRFMVISQSSSFALLELVPIVPRTKRFHLYLVRTENINTTPCLDNEGISCISFLSNSIEREKELLYQKGLSTFDVGKLSINNKILNILFVRGPAGELVEIIDMKENDLRSAR